ncbi:glycosyltransferase family A protein [Sphingomonas hengshuiensis]|uniref:Glycosyltransferase 2-like domain-containing protein n=1 Tax=Sphingomonas hengshuiensis TaxID=1609977 RepID=A0A7U5BGE0_9SPHN|nr:glycosyltransferase family A protein [Sphingomonas hengshuiensis]AJP74784.1 hypothetical protein TS85_23680 [Sphingomonas hengshuiensis]
MSVVIRDCRYASDNYQDRDYAVTIAIPTFNRPEFLRESLESAAKQTGFEDFEILVVDNCSEPENVESVLGYLSYYDGPPLRYYVNETNIGMFGNWNRCLALARGEWTTILSDDDLLFPEFLTKMQAYIDHKPVGSIICQARIMDNREVKPKGVSGFKTELKLRVNRLLRFGFSQRIRLTPRRLFWGNIAGSSLGALFRTREALAMGGFDAREFPSADFDLHLKFARGSGLDQVADQLCAVRLQENESMKVATMQGFFTRDYRRRVAAVEGGTVPRSWARWIPYLLAYEIGVGRRNWGVHVDIAAIEAELGIRVPRRVPAIPMWLVRVAHRGV